MSKFEIFNWTGERKVNEVLQRLGREHNQIVEGDVIDEARRFYDAGLSVMIKPINGSEASALLALDTRSFGQR